MTIYQLAEPKVNNLLNLARTNWHHPRLSGVKIAVLVARDVDKDGISTGRAAIKLGGQPCAANVRVVGLKDRLTKPQDAEILIDGRFLDSASDRETLAVLDHELTHLIDEGDKDDLGRPKLSLREENFHVRGFFEVVTRHGLYAREAQAVKSLADGFGTNLRIKATGFAEPYPDHLAGVDLGETVELPKDDEQLVLPFGGAATASAEEAE